ncbi:MAG: cofactor assembly of complex C subunit B [Cyanobacteria bacterium P01_F01_bin.150]
MAKSERKWDLRQLPIVAGAIAGTALMINRVLTPALTSSQSRSDVVGVIASAVLIFIGLLWQQIQPRPPEAVDLIGTEVFEIDESLADDLKVELAWASHLLLTNTVTKSIVLVWDNEVLLRRGIMGDVATVTLGEILQRVLDKQQPTYLVSLKFYPGRVEFNYLPKNTQGLICQPVGQKGVMILGADVPRSYTKKDENWIAGLADKLGNSLASSQLSSKH